MGLPWTTLGHLGATLGLPRGHPEVTLDHPRATLTLGHPRATRRPVALCAPWATLGITPTRGVGSYAPSHLNNPACPLPLNFPRACFPHQFQISRGQPPPIHLKFPNQGSGGGRGASQEYSHRWNDVAAGIPNIQNLFQREVQTHPTHFNIYIYKYTYK